MVTAVGSKTFTTGVDLSEETRNRVIEILNKRLADSTDLKTQIKHAHWNVKGPTFYQLHELFDELAGHFDEHTDLIAERITALGGVANGTLRQAAAASSIQEYDLAAVTGEQHVRALATRIAKFANACREAIDATDDLGDVGTSDLFTQITRETDKDLWFLEAHVQTEVSQGQLRKAG